MRGPLMSATRPTAALLGLLLAGALLGTATPAQAATGGFEYSVDGSTWSATAPEVLFPDSGFRFVPGAGAAMPLWVRNAHDAPAVLIAALTDIRADSVAAAASFGISGSDGAGEGLERIAVAELADCAHLIPARLLEPGEEALVTTTVHLDAGLVDDQAQREGISFSLALGLRDAALGVPGFGCPDSAEVIPSAPDHGGEVAVTGSELPGRALLVALGMGGAGCLLLLGARRRRRRTT